jgi:hypothetical protein
LPRACGPENDEFEGERMGFTFALCLTRFCLLFGRAGFEERKAGFSERGVGSLGVVKK